MSIGHARNSLASTLHVEVILHAATNAGAHFSPRTSNHNRMNYFEFVTSEEAYPASSKRYERETEKKKAYSKKSMLSQEQQQQKKQKQLFKKLFLLELKLKINTLIMQFFIGLS